MASRSQTIRQSLHLYIDPNPYNLRSQSSSQSPETNSPSQSLGPDSSSSRAVTPTSSTGEWGEWVLFSVLCMHDFFPEDCDQLGFEKNEILEVVKQEDSGWWAAFRSSDSSSIGWVPAAYVVPLTEEMSVRLRNVRTELRVYEYSAEELYANPANGATPAIYDSEPELSPSPENAHRRSYRSVHIISGRNVYQLSAPQVESPLPFLQNGQQRSWPQPPPSPSTPVPQPPPIKIPQSLPPSYFDKPTPPTPKGDTSPRDPVIIRSRREGIRFESTKRASALRRNSDSTAPWYLRPLYADQLELDNEGHIRFGTINALVEKLVCDTSSKDQQKLATDTTIRNTFLMTFRTFMSADNLFDMLVKKYEMVPPGDITDTEHEDWLDKCQLPTQRRILTVFTMWLEDHRLLEEEPQIARRLTDFLTLISTPSPHATTAKLIIQSVERLTFANPAVPTTQPKRRKRSRGRNNKGDLLRMDASEVAEQLAILEYKNYAKISPQECITYAKNQSSGAVTNLSLFCSTHDKLAAWVKTSILNNDALGKRALTVDFWIKVAEKCRNIHNYASMSSLINALSSTVISRLHLTWAHAGRKSSLDNLLKYNEPSGGFSGYRLLQQNVEGSCIPFVGMFLTDICHINDQFGDDGDRICFTRRQRWYEVVSTMLQFQSRPYNIAESESMRAFILTNLHSGSLKEQGWFWSRSQEIQSSEAAHADIRKGLEAAGF